nr:immunoglobulin light chain junction region [Macaca mulatta]
DYSCAIWHTSGSIF